MKKLTFLTLLPLLFVACTSSPQNEPLTKADTVLDNDIFNEATASNNLERCNDILGSELKNSCEQVINDRVATATALESMDKGKCKLVSDERYRTDCETQVAAKLEAKNSDAKRLSTEQKAIDEGDQKLCDQIKAENDMYTCKFNVLNKLATEKNDPSLCDQIGREDLISDCKANAGKK